MRRATLSVLWVVFALAPGLAGCSDGSFLGLTPSAGANGGEADYTILLYVVTGENHTKDVETYRDIVARNSNWTDVYIVHKAGWSELYRGKYATMAAAKSDLRQSRAWRSPVGAQPFSHAMVMPLPGREVGPPAWSLLRTRGVFTVVVAEFYDVPEASYVGRKGFAVQCCREFRAKGLEAYYYHGPAKSFVGIGSFPETSYPSVQRGGRAERVVRDERITAILKKFPYLAVNGRQEVLTVAGQSGKAEKVATASYVWEIPRGDVSEGGGATDRSGNRQPG